MCQRSSRCQGGCRTKQRRKKFLQKVNAGITFQKIKDVPWSRYFLLPRSPSTGEESHAQKEKSAVSFLKRLEELRLCPGVGRSYGKLGQNDLF